jgi:acylphosphatase
MIRRRVVVHGRVQGVFFRDTCRHEAAAQHVSGWVRNRADGCVEAEFEGEPRAVEAMTRWCRRGPSSAHVDDLEMQEQAPTGERGFAVR